MLPLGKTSNVTNLPEVHRPRIGIPEPVNVVNEVYVGREVPRRHSLENQALEKRGNP
jgi:hypothetical protein